MKWRVLLAILVVAIISIFSVNHFAKSRIQQAIAGLSARKINGLYSIRVGRTDVNVWTGHLSASDIVITTDTVAWVAIRQIWPDSFPPLIEMTVQSVNIRRFGWLAYFSERTINLKSATIDQPELHLTNRRDSTTQDSAKQRQWMELPHLIAPLADAVHIGNIFINHADITLHTLQEGDTLKQHVAGLNLSFRQVNVDGKSNEYTYCRDIEVQADKYESRSNMQEHIVSLEQFYLSKKNRKISLQHFSMIPRQTEQAFFEEQHFRRQYISFTCPDITLTGFDLDSLLTNHYFFADSLQFDQPAIAATVNFFLPLPYRKILPHELIQKIKSQFNITKVVIKDCDIAVTARVPGADYVATFNHTYVSAHNLTNDSTLMNAQHPLQIWTEGKFMDQSLLKMQLNLPLLSPTFEGDYTASIENLPLEVLNSVINQKNVRLKSGFIQVADINSTIRNGVAHGTVKVQYNNLEVELLHKDGGKPRIIMSKLAGLVIKTENQKDNDPSTPFITGAIYHVRDRQEGFFLFLLRSIQTGFLPSIIPSYKKLKKAKVALGK